MRVFIFAITMLWTFPVLAQENLPAACKLLSDYNNVVYQPGVDVDGNPVVPADINASPMGDVLNIIKAPLEFDLAQRIAGLNIDGVRQGFNADASSLGTLDIHQNGKVMYNGQDITRPMMTICAKSHKDVKIEVIETVTEPEAPRAPVFDTPVLEVEAPKIDMPQSDFVELPNALAVTQESALEMSAVSAPIVEQVKRPEVSVPLEPKLPLIGIPKGESQTDQSDLIQGQDYRDYNE